MLFFLKCWSIFWVTGLLLGTAALFGYGYASERGSLPVPVHIKSLTTDKGLSCKQLERLEIACLPGRISYGDRNNGVLTLVDDSQVKQHGENGHKKSFDALTKFLASTESTLKFITIQRQKTGVRAHQLTRLFDDCVDYGCVGVKEFPHIPEWTSPFYADAVRIVLTLDTQEPAVGGYPTLRIFGKRGSVVFQASYTFNPEAKEFRSINARIEEECIPDRVSEDDALGNRVMSCFSNFYRTDIDANTLFFEQLDSMTKTFALLE